MVAYGIKNTVTDTEYVSWYNKDKHKYVLFDVTKSKVLDGLDDILSSDEEYNDSISDFIITDVVIPDNYDGAELTNNTFTYVDEAKIVENINKEEE